MSVNDVHPTAAQIVDAAREIFAENGYHKASIAAIARRVGVVDAAIYRHFESKRQLLYEVIRGFYEPLIESARAGTIEIESPRERVRFLIRRHIRAMAEDRLLCRLVISEARSLEGYYQSEVADLSREYTSMFIAAVTDGVAVGDFRSDIPPTVIRDVVYGGIEHLGWRALMGESELDVDVATDQMMTLLFGGLIATPSAPDALDEQLAKLERLVERLGASR